MGVCLVSLVTLVLGLSGEGDEVRVIAELFRANNK